LPALGFLYFSTLAVIPRELSSRSIHEVTPLERSLNKAQGISLAAYSAQIWRWLTLCGLLLTCAAWWPDWALKRLRAKAYQAQGPESLTWIHKALNLASQDASLWADLARLHLRQSPPELDLALKALSKASQLNPRNAIYILLRAEILRSQGLWPKVLHLAELALYLEPGCFQARLLRMEALYRIGRRSEALRELDQMKTLVAAPTKSETSSSPKNYDAFILYKDIARYEEVQALLKTNSQP
jgi:tetratricopeptide (TPR) repeat protein